MADLDEGLELIQAMRRRDDKFVSELSLEEKYDLARRGWAVDMRRAQKAEALAAEWESRYDDMVQAYREAMAKVEKLEAVGMYAVAASKALSCIHSGQLLSAKAYLSDIIEGLAEVIVDAGRVPLPTSGEAPANKESE